MEGHTEGCTEEQMCALKGYKRGPTEGCGDGCGSTVHDQHVKLFHSLIFLIMLFKILLLSIR